MSSEAPAEKRQQIFIPPELSSPRPRDEVLSGDEFMAISVFADIKDAKRTKELGRRLDQHAAILRCYAPGDTVVVQGDAGETAFYVLSDADVVALRQAQLDSMQQLDDFLALGADAPTPKKGQDPREHRLAQFTPDQRNTLKAYYEKEIADVEARAAAGEADSPPATAWLMAQARSDKEMRRRARSLARRLLDFFKKESREQDAPRSISIDASTDIDPNTMRGDIAAGELFGEMSCMHRSPRSATIVANRPCYMVEILRNVLDQLQLDENFRARMRAKYVERVLGGQLRRMSIFKTMTDEQYEWLLDRQHARIEFTEFESGDVLFEEGDDPDALHIIHKGLVKVLQHVRASLLPEDFDEEDWVTLFDAVAALRQEVATARAASGTGDAAAKPKKAPPSPWPERLRESVVDHVQAAFEALAANRTEAAQQQDFADSSEGVTADEVVDPNDEESREALLAGLNAFVADENNMVATRRFPFDKKSGDARWTTIKSIVEDVGDPQLNQIFVRVSNNTEDWSQLEIRLFQRRLLELALPGVVPERIGTGERRRVLAYLGPGQMLGEMGVLQEIVEGEGNGTRNATCIAYDHPDRPTDDIKSPDAKKGAITRVELITIRKHVFKALMDACPPLEEHVFTTIRERRMAVAPRRQATVDSTGSALPSIESQRFEDLGLVQGQQLMLIDLDRCTRCNACVEACISSHDDGRTRLFLDGPQFQSYLVPLTCRSCLDPVCMIGCPVGSINRGSKGEILIEPWCIGCNLCADQCPYGSIQMEPLQDQDAQRIEKHAKGVFDTLGEDIAQFDFKIPKRQAVVCDLCSSSPHTGPACVHACPHEAAIRVNALATFTPTN